MPITIELQYQWDGHHIGLTANRVGELVQRQQCRQRRIRKCLATRNGKHLPCKLMRGLGHLAGADEAPPSGVNGGIDRINRLGAHVYQVFVSQTDQMLRGGEHTGLVIDTDACVKTRRGGSIDTDNRHMDPLELLDFLRLDGERCHEHGVDVTAYRQVGEEITAVLGRIDVLEQGNVVAGLMHHGIDARKHFGVEPAGDLLVHEQGHTVRLPGFQRGRGTGNVEIQLIGRFQYLAPSALGNELGTRECARDC